jgi:hypothetical protein
MAILLNPLNRGEYNYPDLRLNPNVRENIFMGRKLHTLNDYEEQNYFAITALAVGVLCIVGAIMSLSLMQPFLASALTYTGIGLSLLSAVYFVAIRFLNSKDKVEREKQRMEYKTLEEVLKTSQEDIEGFNLFEKIFERRIIDLNPKTREEKVRKFIVCLRQIREHSRILNNMKRNYEETIRGQYLNARHDLRLRQDEQITAIKRNGGIPRQAKNAEIREVNRLCMQTFGNLQTWQRESFDRANENYRSSLDNMERQYRNLISNLGKKSRVSRAIAGLGKYFA